MNKKTFPSQNKRKKNPHKEDIYYLAIPFYFNRGKFSFQKKTQWTVLDLLILRVISDKEYTLDELVKYTNLNKKFLIQIIIPFLKLKWVTLIKQDKEIILHCTEIGKINASFDELPTNNLSYERNREYLANIFTGEYIGLTINKDIYYYNKNLLKDVPDKSPIKIIFLDDYIPIPENNNIIENTKVEKCVTFPFEEYLKPIITTPFFSDKRYLIFTIKVSKINKSLTTDIYFFQNYSIHSQNLINNYFDIKFVEFIRQNFKNIYRLNKEKARKGVPNNLISIGNNNLDSFIEFQIPKDSFRTIYGDDKHREIFFDILENCQNYLIIQTTFIGQWMLTDIEEILLKASQRGVKITILLGKDDYKKNSPEDKDNINLEKFRSFFDNLNKTSNGLISFHHTHTGSHSKTIICEHKTYGHIAIVGSCNWLYTNFTRFEASVLFYNAEVVKKIIEINSILVLGRHQSVPSSLNIELIQLSDQIRINKDINSPKDSVTISLVYKNQHYHYIEQAKNAKNRIFLISDKFNETVHRAIWDMLKIIPTDKKFKFFSYYYSANKDCGLTHDRIKSYGEKLKKLNPNLKLFQDTSKRKNHAKILAWDSENILITSLNWLSADASAISDSFEKYHEIGIYIKKEHIVDDFLQNWEKYKNKKINKIK